MKCLCGTLVLIVFYLGAISNGIQIGFGNGFLMVIISYFIGSFIAQVVKNEHNKY